MEKALTLLLTLLLLCSCGGNNTEQTDGESDTIPMHYAHNLTLVEHDGWTEAILRNPWDTTTVLHRYALLNRVNSEKIKVNSYEGCTPVQVPLKKAAVFTAVHCALIQELGVQQAIGGVCEPEYINLPYIKQGIKKGTITDLGSGMDPSIEHVMQLQPDALMPSPFQNSNGYGRIEQLGIPIIECADYMEVSPLARAEWIRFYGRLFGVEERADSLFSAIEKSYLDLKKKADKVKTRPSVILDVPYQGTWHTPGGRSTMGILYHDAGTNYIFRDRAESGSLPLSFEAVLEAGAEADYWMLRYNQPQPMTLAQMHEDNPVYDRFRAFANKKVYGCNTATSGFYEETPFHPEYLLANLMQIFHPELGIKSEKSYFCRLK